MNIAFENPGFEYSINSILLFQSEELSPFWSAPLLQFYPQIDVDKFPSLGISEKKAYLSRVLYDHYQDIEQSLGEKVRRCSVHFLNHKEQIEDAFSDAFSVDSRLLFNDLSAKLTLNPICPRFLRERYFDIFYMNSEYGALGLSLHEAIHFFWFHVWSRHFADSFDSYESPSLKWILSEMVVEPIMRDPRLASINPYFPRERGGCVYPYFQDMIVDGTPILDTLDVMYRSNSITDFMEQAYRYCLLHEQTIRCHINAAEMT